MKRLPYQPTMQGDSKKQKQQQQKEEEQQQREKEKRAKDREEEEKKRRDEEVRKKRQSEKPTGTEGAATTAAAEQTPLIQQPLELIPMAERQGQHQQRPRRQEQRQQPLSHLVVRAVGAATAGGSMLLLSALTLTATVVGLTVATPLLVICSPILVPAAIGVFFLATGFLSAGAMGLTAVTILSWIYRYLSGKHLPAADQLEQAKGSLYGRVRDVKDRIEHKIQQA